MIQRLLRRSATRYSEPLRRGSEMTEQRKREHTTGSLPCRGCTRACPNRDRCGGMPWRLPRGDEVAPDAPYIESVPHSEG